MIANLKDYKPEHVEFILSDLVKAKFPLTLFDGCDNIEEIIANVNEHFTPLFPENETATRKLDDYEVNQIREEYCIKTEDDLPDARAQLVEAIERARQIKKDAEDKLLAVQTSILELAAKVKQGTADFKLSPNNTIRIALCSHYLFYTWEDGKFQLAKAEKIPEWDARELWSQDEQNRKGMKDLFGTVFPTEDDEPVEEEGTDDDLPWDNEDE